MSEKKFKWTVEFEVEETWVADGFDLTDERALDMLSNDLRYANIGFELEAKVIKSPCRSEILKAQGYTSTQAHEIIRKELIEKEKTRLANPSTSNK